MTAVDGSAPDVAYPTRRARREAMLHSEPVSPPSLAGRWCRLPDAEAIAAAVREEPLSAPVPRVLTAPRSAAVRSAAEPGAPALPRSVRRANRRLAAPRVGRTQNAARWIPRTAVVAALAMSTVALPSVGALSALQGRAVTDLVAPSTGEVAVAAVADTTDEIGPSTLSIVEKAVAEPATPTILAQSVTSDRRALAAASRGEVRSSLPGCDASAVVTGSNGTLNRDQLCELPQGDYYLQPDAAIAFAEMSRAYEVRFGHPITVTSAYRSYAEQASLRVTKPGLAAAAGKSNHGWGYAVDLNSSSYKATAQWQWLQDNAATYGFVNPPWAKSSMYEPWHWEYTPGVVRVDGVGASSY